MRPRDLLVLPLCALSLTACATGVLRTDASTGAGADVETRGHRAAQMADLMLSLAKGFARPEPGAGWSGGWEECVTYSGHEIQFRASGSFGAEAYGRAAKEEILEAVRSEGWRVTTDRRDPGFYSFEVASDGVTGGMVIEDDGVELEAQTGCLAVSAEESERLQSRAALQRGG